jgi:hypothetical protein
MRHQMKWLTAIELCAGMALPASPAQAKDPGPNGQIAFSRVIEDDNTVTYTANADGSHLQQLFRGSLGAHAGHRTAARSRSLPPAPTARRTAPRRSWIPTPEPSASSSGPIPPRNPLWGRLISGPNAILCEGFGVTTPAATASTPSGYPTTAA